MAEYFSQLPKETLTLVYYISAAIHYNKHVLMIPLSIHPTTPSLPPSRDFFGDCDWPSLNYWLCSHTMGSTPRYVILCTR